MKIMDMVHAKLELANTMDVVLFHHKMLKESKIRKVKVTSLVDSGSINENIKEQLGLEVMDRQIFESANGEKGTYDISEPIEVRFINRSTTCRALILPGNSEVLLGSIPMEDLDVIIDPKMQTLALPPDRPYVAQKALK